MILCAGQIEQFSFASPIGIGITEAAINTIKILTHSKPSFALFVGTAGSYGNANIFDLCYSNCSTNIEIGYLLSKSYTPIELIVSSASTSIVSRETMPCVTVNSSNYITIDESLSPLFIEKGVHVENMEFYGFLSAAKALNVDAIGLFCITNFCNANAHNDFITNHNRAKELIAKYIETNFKAFI